VLRVERRRLAGSEGVLVGVEVAEVVQVASGGPDGAGTWADEHAALGHRRLAVIDPAHGRQPMVFAGDRDEPLTVLSCNGEVFNHAELRDELELAGCSGHRAAHYRQAAAQVPVPPGEGPAQRRARENFYLHLVHWLPDLLDRKDRLSMATGLEVRVPFCDHRLVEYAFNVPWSAHTADGREKTLLRAAVAPLLPDAVLGRVKAPCPAAFDPACDDAIRSQARDLLATPNAPAFELLDPERLRLRLDRPPGDRATRAGLDFALNLDAWLRAGPRRPAGADPGPR
jgi:asparagine synthetase B (glutamine-hydrolysing)